MDPVVSYRDHKSMSLEMYLATLLSYFKGVTNVEIWKISTSVRLV
jgi:hypothetical protein